MKKRDLSVLLILAFLSTATVLSGCASNRGNLVDKGALSIELVTSGRVYFSRVYVYQEDRSIMVTGRVKSRFHSRFIRGHVDLTVVNPEGEILEKISTSHTPTVFPRRRGRRHLGVHFNVLLPIVPPFGSKVRLAYHDTQVSGGEIFDCGKNVASNNS
jgi:hypothetical protein